MKIVGLERAQPYPPAHSVAFDAIDSDGREYFNLSGFLVEGRWSIRRPDGMSDSDFSEMTRLVVAEVQRRDAVDLAKR
jgi:hypothetical protein